MNSPLSLSLTPCGARLDPDVSPKAVLFRIVNNAVCFINYGTKDMNALRAMCVYMVFGFIGKVIYIWLSVDFRSD